MAEMSAINVYDDSSTPVLYLLEPTSDTGWVEQNTAKAPMGRVRAAMSSLLLKNKMTRRMFKTDVPVMEQLGTAGNNEGYVSAPRIAHTVSVSTAVFCDDNRATPIDIANALKLHINAILGDALAGTGAAYVNATNLPRKFMTTGVGAD